MDIQTQRIVNERINLYSDIELYKLAEKTVGAMLPNLPLEFLKRPDFYLNGLWVAAMNPELGQDQVALFIKNRNLQTQNRRQRYPSNQDFTFYKLREDMSDLEYLHSTCHGLAGWQLIELLQFKELLPEVCKNLDLSEEEREVVRLRLQKEFMQHFIADMRLQLSNIVIQRRGCLTRPYAIR